MHALMHSTGEHTEGCKQRHRHRHRRAGSMKPMITQEYASLGGAITISLWLVTSGWALDQGTSLFNGQPAEKCRKRLPIEENAHSLAAENCRESLPPMALR